MIPLKLQKQVLETLHESHTGIVRMKMLARSYVFWPDIDKDIHNFVNNCEVCQMTQNVSREHITSKWPPTKYPFERIHLDFFFHAVKTFLILVDSYSKYIEVCIMNKTDAQSLINSLQKFFVVFGLPTEIVTDNGPPFGSYVFNQYCKHNNIKLSLSPPYHPQSNGLGERAVQTVKKVLKKFLIEKNKNITLPQQVDTFLQNYRNTQSTATGQTPNSLVFGYKTKTVMDAINPRPQQNYYEQSKVYEEKSHSNLKSTNFSKYDRSQRVEREQMWSTGDCIY